MKITNWSIKKWQSRYIDSMEMLIIDNAGWYEKDYDFANDEVLDIEIRMLRNCILWKYNCDNFGLDKGLRENENKRNVGMDKFFGFASDEEKSGAVKTRLVQEDLKNKCILSNVWCPEKLYTVLSYELDFLSDYPRGYYYDYYQYLGIGKVTSGGNHRMFVETIRNLDCVAEIDAFDDRKMLEDFRTDGSYFYKVDDSSVNVPLGDERLALLITLVQLKLGIIKDLRKYMDEAKAIRDSEIFLYETEENKARREEEQKAMSTNRNNKKHWHIIFLKSLKAGAKTFCETWKEAKEIEG